MNKISQIKQIYVVLLHHLYDPETFYNHRNKFMLHAVAIRIQWTKGQLICLSITKWL